MLDTERRAALAALAAIGAVATSAATFMLPAPALAAAFDLVQLMHTLAQVKAGEATFVETRSVAILERTLESSGRLWFEAPDTFVRETLKPRREKVEVVGNNVTMTLGTRSRTVPLDSVPEAAVIMEAIRATLTGNRASIERHFDATVSGTPQRWSLELKPREPRLRELVIAVRVAGQQGVVREMTVAMADGDRSVMVIDPVAAITPAPASSRPASAAS